jgi:hypothetical protein
MAGRSEGRGQRLAALTRRQSASIGPFDIGRPHLTHKAQTLARYGSDQFLLVATVTDRFSRGVDATCKSLLRYNPATPHRTDEIVLTDDSISVLDKVNQ